MHCRTDDYSSSSSSCLVDLAVSRNLSGGLRSVTSFPFKLAVTAQDRVSFGDWIVMNGTPTDEVER
jgi:hypothetical protein